jgi:hypothetical protein
VTLRIEPTFAQRLDQVAIETHNLLRSPEVREDPELWGAVREVSRAYLRRHDEPPSGEGPMFELLREKIRSLERNLSRGTGDGGGGDH